MQTDAALRSIPIHAQGMRRQRARMVEQGGDWRDGPAVAAILLLATGAWMEADMRHRGERGDMQNADVETQQSTRCKARTNNDIDV